MDKFEFENSLKETFPSAVVNSEEFGACTWIRLYVNERAFAVQITISEGIGVSEVNSSMESDYGHDNVFQKLEQVFEFIKGELTK